jgi:hypothetical protein
MNAKTLIAAAVLATALASPAMAQIATRNHLQAFSSQPDESGQIGEPRAIKRSYDIYLSGQYVGSNPDPNIRRQLQGEYDSGEW